MTRISKAITWLCDRFADAFGTPLSFAVWAVLLVVWLAPVAPLGFQHWNATWGLAGNTTESTVELFLAIATLVQANQIKRLQADHHELIGQALAGKDDET